MITTIDSEDGITPAVQGLSVIEFSRDDCVYCDMLDPVIEDVHFELPFIEVLKVNCSRVPGASDTFDVRAFPTTRFFKDGQQVEEIVGFVPAPVLRDTIGRHLY